MSLMSLTLVTSMTLESTIN